MPKVTKDFPITIGYRDSAAGVQKLDELSRRMGRPRADVLRLLVAIAEPTDLPAVRLGAPTDLVAVSETAPG
jgi:hypothetical protein